MSLSHQFPWPVEKLGDLSKKIDYGHTASATRESVGPRFLRITDIQEGTVDWEHVPFCPCDQREREQYALAPGDIVFARTGATTGKSFLIRECPAGAVFASYLIRVRPKPAILPGYLAWFFQTPHYWRQVQRNSTGTAQEGVNATKLRDLGIPLPPFPEQRRIAAILDKADAIQRKRRETIRLTEEFLRSAFLEIFGDPVTNPKGWPTQNLGELADFVGGGTLSRAVPSYFEGTTCWATREDMSGEFLEDTQEHITDQAIANSATKLVQPGTILVVVKSKVLMHRLPVLIAAVPTCLGQDLEGIVLKGQHHSLYVARHMRIGQASLLRLARGVNPEGLTLEHLRGYQVMVPPLALVRRHEFLEQKTLQLRKRVSATHARSADLAAVLTDRAFRGGV